MFCILYDYFSFIKVHLQTVILTININNFYLFYQGIFIFTHKKNIIGINQTWYFNIRLIGCIIYVRGAVAVGLKSS